jgi:hypothetical protein
VAIGTLNDGSTPILVWSSRTIVHAAPVLASKFVNPLNFVTKTWELDFALMYKQPWEPLVDCTLSVVENAAWLARLVANGQLGTVEAVLNAATRGGGTAALMPSAALFLDAAIESNSVDAIEWACRLLKDSVAVHNRRAAHGRVGAQHEPMPSSSDDPGRFKLGFDPSQEHDLSRVIARLAHEHPELCARLLDTLPLIEAHAFVDARVGPADAAAVGRGVVGGPAGYAFEPDQTLVVTPSPFLGGPSGLWQRHDDNRGPPPTSATFRLTSSLVQTVRGAARQFDRTTADSLLRALVDTNNAELFSSLLVKSIIEHKWRAFSRRIYVRDAVVYAAGLVATMALLFAVLSTPHMLDSLASIVIASINAAFALRHLVLHARRLRAAASSIREYVADLWAAADVLQNGLTVAALVSYSLDGRDTRILLAFAVYLKWVGLLYYLLGVFTDWAAGSDGGRDCQGHAPLFSGAAHRLSGRIERAVPAGVD